MATAKLAGSVEFPFSTLVRETIETHGETWAYDYYVNRHGLARWEYRLFAGLGSDGLDAEPPRIGNWPFTMERVEVWEHFAH